jgi:thiol:disulfide interchange protein DsbD
VRPSQRAYRGYAAALALFAACAAPAPLPSAAAEQDLLRPEQAFRLSARVGAPGELEVQYRIADGYYMYRDKFRFSADPEQVALAAPGFPEGTMHEDEYFGRVETFRGELRIRIPFEARQGVEDLQLHAISQGCADAGICYLPQTQTVRLRLAQAQDSSPARTGTEGGGVLSRLRQLAGSEPEPEFLPVDKAFAIRAALRDARTIAVDFEPAQGYYLYRDKIAFALSASGGLRLGRVELPPGEKKDDPNFGPSEVFHQPVQARIALSKPAVPGEPLGLEVRYQGCADAGLCYPPETKSFDLTLAAARDAGPPTGERAGAAAQEAALGAAPAVARRDDGAKLPGTAATGERAGGAARDPGMPDTGTAAPALGSDSPPAAVDDSTRTARLLSTGGFWAAIASFFGFGLLLATTPCVFPMIPILSGIIVGHGQRVTRGHALALSLAYVLGMALTYAVAGVAAGLAGTLLSNALQQPAVLAAFSALFVLLALSMFGLYELQLPAALQSRLSSAANRLPGGRFAGVFAMGVLSALIVGPCVAAPLAGALLYINQSRDALLGGSALFAMALGMGAPLLAVGASAGSLLPKAGVWMQTVKNFFGVVLIGLAIWIVSPVIPAAAHMLLWAALLIVSAIYLHAIDPLPHNASGLRKLWKGIGVIALLLGVALLVGVLSGSRDILQPLSGLRQAGAAAGQASAPVRGEAPPTQPGFVRVRSVAELERLLAKARGRPVMLDFYADWCTSCKEMERFTFTDPAVRSRMNKMVLLKVDLTRGTADDAELLRRFNLFGPPGTVFFDARGRELGYRVIGFQTAERFAASLDLALYAL